MDAQLGRVLDELDRLRLADEHDHRPLGRSRLAPRRPRHVVQAHQLRAGHAHPAHRLAPDMKRRGERSAALVETVDIYPTIAELTGRPAPAVPQKLDGNSFARLLDREGAATKAAIFHAYPRNVPRRGGFLIGRAVRTARYRLVEWKQPGGAPETADLELYDYEADPAETRNLAADEPSVVATLRALLAAQGEAKLPPPPQPAR